MLEDEFVEAGVSVEVSFAYSTRTTTAELEEDAEVELEVVVLDDDLLLTTASIVEIKRHAIRPMTRIVDFIFINYIYLPKEYF